MSTWRAVIDLPATAGSPTTARHLLAELLTAWGLPDLADDGTLILSEIVTNAYRHAPGTDTLQLEILRLGHGVRISLADGSSKLPVLAEPGSDGRSGRGLQIVETLATDWGAEKHHGGKRVWIRLDRPPA